jgi:hypothetical protein
MILEALTAAALSGQPCLAPLPRGPAVPAPIVLWTSCGAFRLDPDGATARLPRHWLAQHGSGTGRRYGADLALRRTRDGRILLLRHGRVVWRSHDVYPRDSGDVAFGPRVFAFASYRRGVFVTDLRGPERLVVSGRGLYPYAFTRSGRLFVTGGRAIALVPPGAGVIQRFPYRARNGLALDAGVTVSADGRAVAFRLSDGRPGARSGTAIVYLLQVGAMRAQAIYRDRLGPVGCGGGASLSWHGSSLLYRSIEGRLVVLRSGRVSDVTAFAARLPGAPGGAGWLSDFRR